VSPHEQFVIYAQPDFGFPKRIYDTMAVTRMKLASAKRIISYLLVILVSRSQRKHAYRWLQSLKLNYLLDAKVPWITFDTIDFLEQWLRPKRNLKVFEWGSGGSTLFWLKFNATLISVEHEPQWFASIRGRICASENFDCRIVPPERAALSLTADPADPTSYLSTDPLFQGYTFKNYASQIDAFPDRYFDVVMIDGRARPSCIMHSAGKVRLGGLLILDNADRLYYTAKTKEFLEDFTCQQFYGVGPCGRWMWRTDIYTRRR
jgi:hypothetical protein